MESPNFNRDDLAHELKKLRSEGKRSEAKDTLMESQQDISYIQAQRVHKFDIYNENLKASDPKSPFVEPLKHHPIRFQMIGDNEDYMVRTLARKQPKEWPFDKERSSDETPLEIGFKIVENLELLKNNYGVNVSANFVVGKDEESGWDTLFAIVSKVNGTTLSNIYKLESEEESFAKKEIVLYSHLIDYYKDRITHQKSIIFDITKREQFVYGTTTEDSENKIYLVDVVVMYSDIQGNRSEDGFHKERSSDSDAENQMRYYTCAAVALGGMKRDFPYAAAEILTEESFILLEKILDLIDHITGELNKLEPLSHGTRIASNLKHQLGYLSSTRDSLQSYKIKLQKV